MKTKQCRDCGKEFQGTCEQCCDSCFKKILKRQNSQMKKVMDKAIKFFQEVSR